MGNTELQQNEKLLSIEACKPVLVVTQNNIIKYNISSINGFHSASLNMKFIHFIFQGNLVDSQ